MKAQARSANLRNARFLLAVGEDEIRTETLQMKNLETGEQSPVPRAQLLAAVRKVLEG